MARKEKKIENQQMFFTLQTKKKSEGVSADWLGLGKAHFA